MIIPSQTVQLPTWFKQDIPDQNKMTKMRELLAEFELHTVCQEARCPNIGQCWKKRVATFMILGDTCSRSCRFCAVRHEAGLKPDRNEPLRVAQAVEKLQLKYVVITSVTRDDLLDGGAGQFAKTLREIQRLSPQTSAEVLIPDFQGEPEALKVVVDAAPQVIGHNMETIKRLYSDIRPQADYIRSLKLLRKAKKFSDKVFLKSGFMVGLGESFEEVIVLMEDLFSVGCEILTIGQYLSPLKTKRHVAVKKFYTPKEFEDLRHRALKIGFKVVKSGPYVRSSYEAQDCYQACL